MKMSGPFVLLLAAGAAQAQPAPTKPVVAPSAAQGASQMPAAKRFPGVSDEGNAILAKAQSAPDPQLQAIGRQLKTAHDQLLSAAMAPVIDVDKVAAAIKAEESAQAELRTRNNDRLIAVLKQLPADDRGNFLRNLVLSRQPRAVAPAAPASFSPQP